MSHTPQRIHRERRRGWRKPDGAVDVTRASPYGNPWKLGVACARMPALNGDPWEPETRLSGPDTRHDYYHPGGLVTVHHTRLMTQLEVVLAFARDLRAYRRIRGRGDATLADIRRDLTGKDLMCYCRIGDACHADVLLQVANMSEAALDHFMIQPEGEWVDQYIEHLCRALGRHLRAQLPDHPYPPVA